MKSLCRLLLIFAVALASLPAGADAASSVPVSLVTTESIDVALAAAPAPATCNMTLIISFRGFRTNTGVVYGTWTHYASTLCKLPNQFKMNYLFVQDKLFEFGIIRQANIPDSCENCLAVASQSPGALSCNPCNGPWYGTSQHLLRFPFIIGGFVPTKPGTCKMKNLTTIECNLRTATVVLA